MDGIPTREGLPPPDRDIDITRINLDRARLPADTLGREQRRAGAAESVEHQLIALGDVFDRVGDQGDLMLPMRSRWGMLRNKPRGLRKTWLNRWQPSPTAGVYTTRAHPDVPPDNGRPILNDCQYALGPNAAELNPRLRESAATGCPRHPRP
jgi:hypothetical protein